MGSDIFVIRILTVLKTRQPLSQMLQVVRQTEN